jgi:hypothetical protein
LINYKKHSIPQEHPSKITTYKGVGTYKNKNKNLKIPVRAPSKSLGLPQKINNLNKALII